MPERWRAELKKIDRLHPDHDLVERTATRPLRPLPAPCVGTRIAIMAFALLIAAAGSYGVFTVLRNGSPDVPAAGGDRPDGVTAPTNGELLYAKYVGTEGWSLFAVDPETSQERRITYGYRDYGSDWSPDSTKIVYDSEVKGTGVKKKSWRSGRLRSSHRGQRFRSGLVTGRDPDRLRRRRREYLGHER